MSWYEFDELQYQLQEYTTFPKMGVFRIRYSKGVNLVGHNVNVND